MGNSHINSYEESDIIESFVLKFPSQLSTALWDGDSGSGDNGSSVGNKGRGKGIVCILLPSIKAQPEKP